MIELTDEEKASKIFRKGNEIELIPTNGGQTITKERTR
jgi:hypothetical protein